MGDVYPSGRNIAVESLGQMLRSLRESAERKAQQRREFLDWQQRMEARKATEAFRETSLEWQQERFKQEQELRKTAVAEAREERKEAREARKEEREAAAAGRKEAREFRETEAGRAETQREFTRDTQRAQMHFQEHGEYPSWYTEKYGPAPAVPPTAPEEPIPGTAAGYAAMSTSALRRTLVDEMRRQGMPPAEAAQTAKALPKTGVIDELMRLRALRVRAPSPAEVEAAVTPGYFPVAGAMAERAAERWAAPSLGLVRGVLGPEAEERLRGVVTAGAREFPRYALKPWEFGAEVTRGLLELRRARRRPGAPTARTRVDRATGATPVPTAKAGGGYSRKDFLAVKPEQMSVKDFRSWLARAKGNYEKLGFEITPEEVRRHFSGEMTGAWQGIQP